MARCLALVSLLLLGLASAASAADAPFVVAHKKVSLSRPKPGVERVAVSLDLYNQGSATAYDVSLNDDSWPTQAFELVTGEKSKTLERLDPGATATHTYVLETKTQGRFQGSPAIITYRVPTKTALQALEFLMVMIKELLLSHGCHFDLYKSTSPNQSMFVGSAVH
uniref:Translocon-associated protein beta (TRAPB) family protein n=1 Tax=Zea mays TaxID=4577 RepID=C4JBE5_MAIZE|nr:unknown [Zea mays]